MSKIIKFLILPFAFFSFPTHSLPILDQSQLSDNGGASIGSTLGTYSERGQSFTVGIAGQLTSLQVDLSRTSSLSYDLYKIQDGHISNTSIAYGIVGYNEIANRQFTTLDFSDFNIFVNTGDRFMIGLRPTASNTNGLRIAGGPIDTYAGGKMYLRSEYTNMEWSIHPDNSSYYDWVFKTFVDPNAKIPLPIHEPSSIYLLILSLFIIYKSRQLKKSE